ncbi:MAG TPA: M14 family zinc carboxypeptidase [Solirubrobacterales bacterium]|nr:M14 family zinc carboxypeptidase [Solirubrobacterales bacterium]
MSGTRRAAAVGALLGCLLLPPATAANTFSIRGMENVLGGAAAGERTVIGHSVQGRPIVATLSGSPEAPLRVLVVGCVHGDEPAGLRVVRRLLGAPPLRRAALWIVPALNPDGLAAGTRGNAHGVDLNRNFPFGWRPLGGLEHSGPRPLSEPESRAAAQLTRRLRPDLTIWFHQPFGLVDRSGGNVAVERRFAQLAGLPLGSIPRPPGSASSWQNRVLPRGTAFVVELPATVGAPLVTRTARAVRALAGELASPGLAAAVAATP